VLQLKMLLLPMLQLPPLPPLLQLQPRFASNVCC
jgi:hypothetical protein